MAVVLVTAGRGRKKTLYRIDSPFETGN